MTRGGAILRRLRPSSTRTFHIESANVTACAYAEAALISGVTTIFCDSHEIGNVMDVAGVEAMLGGRAPGAVVDLPHRAEHGAGDLPRVRDAGGDLTPEKIAGLFDRLARGGGARREDGLRQVAMATSAVTRSSPPR